MKSTFKTFLYGATVAFGTQVGIDVFRKLKNPVTRANIKKRFIKIKDAVLGKDGP